MIILFLFLSARVVTDRVSGYSKGYGFVRYATLEDAEAGIKGMDGQVSCDTDTNVHLFPFKGNLLDGLNIVGKAMLIENTLYLLSKLW